MTKSETDILTEEVDTSGPLVLSNDLKVDVKRLRMRETMKLLRIITRGAGYALSTLSVEDENFAETLILSVMLAIPEAEDETVDFLRFMVTPSEYINNPKSKAEKEVNAGFDEQLEDLLDNPELIDAVEIISRIIRNEADDIQALGKQIGLLLKTFRPDKS